VPVGERLPRAEDEAIHRVHREAEVRDLAVLKRGVGLTEAATERRGVRRDEDGQRVHGSGSREPLPPEAVTQPTGGPQLRYAGSE
jgi:hypothetical protein